MSTYDAQGNRLSTVRLARMPQKHKASLKKILTEEIEAAFRQRPDLKLVKLAESFRQ